MVVLDEPVYMDEYGQLPDEGQFDYLAQERGRIDATFTAVGYGLQNANKNHQSARRLRMLARPRLIIMNNAFTGDFSILMSSNANTGGTCFGDSGGPLFYGGDESNLLVGVTSYAINSECAGTGGVYRIDRADDLEWLYGVFRRLPARLPIESRHGDRRPSDPDPRGRVARLTRARLSKPDEPQEPPLLLSNSY